VGKKNIMEKWEVIFKEQIIKEMNVPDPALPAQSKQRLYRTQIVLMDSEQ